MKKFSFILMAIFFVFSFQAQEKVEIKDTEPFLYLIMEFEGPHALTTEKIPIFIQEIQKQEIHAHPPLFGLYYPLPLADSNEKPKWGICAKAVDDLDVQPPLKKLEFNYEKIATIIHIGPYDTVSNSFNIIYPYIEENGYQQIGPTITMWLDDPNQVKPEECRTQIIIPVKKIEE